MSRGEGRRRLLVLALVALTSGVVSCRQKMADQPSYDPLEPSSFFEDGMSSRPLIEGTVARGLLRNDPHLEEGKVGDALATTFPFPVTMDVMKRGQARYDIYCSPCHGKSGDGNGMIVQRGYRRPPAFASERLADQPPGHFFDVMTNGFGAMPPYRHQISPEDRWAIAAYMKALQASQQGTIADVPTDRRSELERAQ